MRPKRVCRVDPKTGALLFSADPEETALQGLQRQVKALEVTVSELSKEVKQLKEILMNGGKPDA